MAKKKTKKEKKSHGPLIALVLVVVLLLGIGYIYRNRQTTPPLAEQMPTFNFGNQRILLDNEALSFSNGSYSNGEHTATLMDQVVSLSGNRGAAILVDNPGGSGTFYYLIGATNNNGVQTFSSPVPLGDRIKMDSVVVTDSVGDDNGVVTVMYWDRGRNEPMVAEPTVQVIKKYTFQDDGNLIEVRN